MAYKIVNNIKTAVLLQDLMQEISGQPATILQIDGKSKEYRVQCNGIGYGKLNNAMRNSKYKSLRRIIDAEEDSL